MNALKIDWPAHVPIKGSRYLTPAGDFPRVTTVLKAFGGGTEGLIKWSATEERKACLAACAEVYASPDTPVGPAEFVAAVEANLGPARQHQKVLAKAGEIGTSIHAMIQWTLRQELGEDPGQRPVLSDPAEVAVMSWSDWWRSKGLVPVRIEQPIWHPTLGYAGTIDLIAEGHDGLSLWDWKSSAGIYETHHMQAAAYVHAANLWAPVSPGGIVKMPKDINGDLSVTEVPIGHLYGGRVLSLEQLVAGFTHTLDLWNLLMSTNGKER